MKFNCDSCLTERNFHGEYGILIITPRGQLTRHCRICVNPRVGVPDIYWDGKPEENLADDPLTEKPRVFGSKAEKAAYLREKGIREAGDRHHGAPVMVSRESMSTPSYQESRHEVRMALKKVKEMGQDVKRQAYLKILKEGRNAQR